MERLCDTDPHALADGESVEALHRCLARLEAATTRASAAFDASRAWEADGARSAGAWLARRCGLASSSARRRVRLGRSLRHLPVAEAAWLAGELGEAQVAALARARTPASEAAMERATSRCWWARPAGCAWTPSCGCWPTGANTPIPTGPRTTRQRLERPGACTCRRASRACGSGTWCWTPSAGRWCPTSCGASTPSSSTPTGPPAWASRPAPRRWSGRSAGPTPWWRWPGEPARFPPGLATPSRCSRCWWAMRPSPAHLASVVSPGALVEWLEPAERVVFDGPSRVIDQHAGATRRAGGPGSAPGAATGRRPPGDGPGAASVTKLGRSARRARQRGGSPCEWAQTFGLGRRRLGRLGRGPPGRVVEAPRAVGPSGPRAWSTTWWRPWSSPAWSSSRTDPPVGSPPRAALRWAVRPCRVICRGCQRQCGQPRCPIRGPGQEWLEPLASTAAWRTRRPCLPGRADVGVSQAPAVRG